MCTEQPASPTLCGACSEPFADPRLLPCLHSFCRTCLEREAAKGSGDAVACPTCQRHVSLSPGDSGGVAALPKNLRLAFEVEVAKYCTIIESTSDIKCGSCNVASNDPSRAFCCTCREFLCQYCWDYHRASRKLQSHETVPLSRDAPSQLAAMMKPNESCTTHKGEALNFYCQRCNCFVCQDCLLGTHFGHEPIGLFAVARQRREELDVALGHTLKSLREMREAIAVCRGRINQMEGARETMTQSLNRVFEGLHRVLEERCGELVGRVGELTSSKLQPLATQLQWLEGMEVGLDACSSMASLVLRMHTDCQVVALGGLLPLEASSLVQMASSYQPKLQSDVICCMDEGSLVKSISQFGAVDSCCSAKSTWVQLHTSPPVVHTPYQVRLETRDFSGGLVMSGGLEVVVELRSKMDDTPCTRGKVEDHGDGTYTITITPLATGQHQLCITIYGHHVFNSPCDVTVLNEGRDYGKMGTTMAQIPVSAPHNVAVHNNGNIYVTGGTNYIHVFDAAGNNTFTIGGSGSSDGTFYNPRGMAIKGDKLYVADDSNNRVQEFTESGGFVRKIGQLGAGPGSLNGPMDLCFDLAGRMYVADYNNHRVQAFGQNGAFLYSIAGSVSGGGAFSFPWGVALDPQENIHVVAWGTESVKVFSCGGPSPGTFVRSYGSLSHPTGIAIDLAGSSFVTDYGTNSLLVFDPQGNLVHAIRRLNRPYGVAVDRNGFVYVANSGANQIVKI